MKAETRRLYDLWTSGEELTAGQELYESIPNHNRPLWAAAILMFSIAESSLDLAPVNDVLEIAQDERRWCEAHKAFGAVRDMTLKSESAGYSNEHVALLFIAEIAAKVTYNASGEPAPFDADSGAWMAKNFRHFVAVCHSATEQDSWKLLAPSTWRNPSS